MINGLLIGLREGVEASLVVGIVVAYLVRTGNAGQLPKIWLGTAAAIAASVLLGLVLYVTVGELGSPYEQLFEATAMLVATGVVTWMLFWMRSHARAIRGELESQLARALSDGSAWGLAVLAFTAVIREGIETSLFVFGQVTAVRGSGPATAGDQQAVLWGALAGLLLAVAIGYGIYRGSRRLNLRAFFLWTGVGLVFVAAGLVSRAVHELIEIHVVGVGTQTAFDISALLPSQRGPGQLLNALFGYSSQPEIVTLAVYLVYVVAILAFFLAPQRSPRPARTGAA